MNIDKYKVQHVSILRGIDELRRLSHAGVAENTQGIAKKVVELSGIVRMHLSIEDKYLYPTLEGGGDPKLRQMSRVYQAEMDGISEQFLAFAGRWNTSSRIAQDPDGFRSDANLVLRQVFDRMQRENKEFYPAIEASTAVAA